MLILISETDKLVCLPSIALKIFPATVIEWNTLISGLWKKTYKAKVEYEFNYNFQDSSNHISSPISSKMKGILSTDYIETLVHFLAATTNS